MSTLRLGFLQFMWDWPSETAITEVRRGSYAFVDAFYKPIAPEFNCALTLLTTVISRTEPNRAIIDAGKNSITLDLGTPEVKGMEDIKVARLWDEHEVVEITRCDKDIKVGSKLKLIPSHVCTTIHLHNELYAIRNDESEAIWKVMPQGKAS